MTEIENDRNSGPLTTQHMLDPQTFIGRLRELWGLSAGDLSPAGVALDGLENAVRGQNEQLRLRDETIMLQGETIRGQQIDGKTLLPNYFAFRDALTDWGKQTFAPLRRQDDVIAEESLAQKLLVMIDLDHFKDVNDSLSRLVGDRTLRMAGHLFRMSVRKSDGVYRIGGDEFGALTSQNPAQFKSTAAIIEQRFIENLTIFNNSPDKAAKLGFVPDGMVLNELDYQAMRIVGATFESVELPRGRTWPEYELIVQTTHDRLRAKKADKGVR